jgi:hypothetical protein
MFMKCLAWGAVVGGVIALAAMAYGCQMGLKEPEFGWMAGIVVAGLGVCVGLLVFLISLIVGLVAKAAAKHSIPVPNIGSEQCVAPQSATRAELDSEGGDQPQPESKPRPR